MLRVASVLVTGVFCAGIISCSSTRPYDAGVEADAISQLSRQWLAADVSKNVEAAVEMYADDAVEMPSNTPIVVGKEAIRKWYQNWLPNPSNSITFATTDVQVALSGDLAYERGTYKFVTNGPKGRTEEVGKYVTVWKRVGGKWKVLADMNASDQPASGS